ncbi:hypothetical protein CRUP_001127, partial [Coryphaenoides rupestris]
HKLCQQLCFSNGSCNYLKLPCRGFSIPTCSKRKTLKMKFERSSKAIYIFKERHRAVNLFLQGYEKSWIEAEEHYFEDKLIEDLAKSGKDEPAEDEDSLKHIDPLHQLIQLFSRTALTEKCKLDEDNLYMAYADIMAKSCHDEEEEDGDEVKSFEEKEMEKQKLLYQQARLHDRGAAEMVLQTISASKGWFQIRQCFP